MPSLFTNLTQMHPKNRYELYCIIISCKDPTKSKGTDHFQTVTVIDESVTFPHEIKIFSKCKRFVKFQLGDFVFFKKVYRDDRWVVVDADNEGEIQYLGNVDSISFESIGSIHPGNNFELQEKLNIGNEVIGNNYTNNNLHIGNNNLHIGDNNLHIGENNFKNNNNYTNNNLHTRDNNLHIGENNFKNNNNYTDNNLHIGENNYTNNENIEIIANMETNDNNNIYNTNQNKQIDECDLVPDELQKLKILKSHFIKNIKKYTNLTQIQNLKPKTYTDFIGELKSKKDESFDLTVLELIDYSTEKILKVKMWEKFSFEAKNIKINSVCLISNLYVNSVDDFVIGSMSGSNFGSIRVVDKNSFYALTFMKNRKYYFDHLSHGKKFLNGANLKELVDDHLCFYTNKSCVNLDGHAFMKNRACYFNHLSYGKKNFNAVNLDELADLTVGIYYVNFVVKNVVGYPIQYFYNIRKNRNEEIEHLKIFVSDLSYENMVIFYRKKPFDISIFEKLIILKTRVKAVVLKDVFEGRTIITLLDFESI